MYGCKPVEIRLIVAVEQSESPDKLVYLGDSCAPVANFPCRGATPLKNGIQCLLDGSQRCILCSYGLIEPCNLIVESLFLGALLVEFRP